MERIWQPIKEAGNLTDRIVARIEELIVKERVEPGERLPSERELAKLLGVSRPALREAVKTLEARGRLTVRHGQGVFIAASSEELMRARLANLEVSMVELYAMRNVLEVPAAEWAAASASSDAIEKLRSALETEEEARRPPIDFDKLTLLDAGFHLLIVEIANNRFLLQTLGILQEMISAGMETTLSVPGRIERSRQDHRDIFEAIQDHDPKAAGLACAKHINAAKEAALSRIRASD